MSAFVRNPYFLDQIREEVADRLVVAATDVRDRARESLDRAGTGAKHRGLPRQSSAPGEPPVSQTGELRESLKVYGPFLGPEAVEVRMGTDLFWARWLEMGTARIQPRPFLLPALLESKADILVAMEGDV